MFFKKLCSLFVRLTVAGVVSAAKLRFAPGRVNRSYHTNKEIPSKQRYLRTEKLRFRICPPRPPRGTKRRASASPRQASAIPTCTACEATGRGCHLNGGQVCWGTRPLASSKNSGQGPSATSPWATVSSWGSVAQAATGAAPASSAWAVKRATAPRQRASMAPSSSRSACGLRRS